MLGGTCSGVPGRTAQLGCPALPGWPLSVHRLATARRLASRDPARAVRGAELRPHAAPDAAAATSSSAQQQQEQRQQVSAPAAARQQASPAPAPGSASLLSSSPSLLRRMLGAASSAEALDLVVQHLGAVGGDPASPSLTEADADILLTGSLEQGNVQLALSVYQDMCRMRRLAQVRSGGAGAGAAARHGGGAASPAWPPATLQSTAVLVLGLCRQLQVAQALAVIRSIQVQGLPRAEEVSFGYVVSSPLPPRRPLAVVQPQEGRRVVADAATRYEFELFSGVVTSAKSEALAAAGAGLLGAAARAVGLLRRPPVAAVHEWVVQAPDGMSRTFRAGTSSADVPAQVGERVSVVCSPSEPSTRQRRLLLSTGPPGSRAGQPLLVANHSTGAELLLLRPPASGSQGLLPGWALPVVAVLASSDAASALVDPSLPALLAGGVAVAVGSAVAGNSLLLPRLKQLPASAVMVEEIRQQLLAQHGRLAAKVKSTLQEASDDVQKLARLWQLQDKMQAVGATASSAAAAAAAAASTSGGALPAGGGVYDARMVRVASARAGLEERLAKRLELLDGYARVMSMIEIEVELETAVPASEMAGIEEQLEKLSELESLQQEWQIQAEASDEVERLLRLP